jgi:hypothetical protein
MRSTGNDNAAAVTMQIHIAPLLTAAINKATILMRGLVVPKIPATGKKRME